MKKPLPIKCVWKVCMFMYALFVALHGQKETAASHRMMYPMVLKNYIGGMAVVAMSGRPAQRQDQAVRIARFAVTPESLRVSMTLRV